MRPPRDRSVGWKVYLLTEVNNVGRPTSSPTAMTKRSETRGGDGQREDGSCIAQMDGRPCLLYFKTSDRHQLGTG